MSLWTPDGERPVSADTPSTETPATETPAAESPMPDGGQPIPESLTPEQEEQARAMAHELAEARARLLETDVSTVLANHAFGIYELAAIHLTAEEPKLSEASLAIDALTALTERLAGNLGEHEDELRGGLQQMQMLFVQRSSAAASDGSD